MNAPGQDGRFVSQPGASERLFRSFLYREFLVERGEILKHKWMEPEKAGADIGFENEGPGFEFHRSF